MVIMPCYFVHSTPPPVPVADELKFKMCRGHRVWSVKQVGVQRTTFSLDEAPPSPPERREGQRHLSLFRVGSLLVNGRRELCLIRNVSAGGMMIRAYCQLEPGAAISVELKHGSQVSGTVKWVQSDVVGVAFDPPIDVVGLLAGTVDGAQPRMPRIEVDCLASVREDGTIHRVRVRDISQGGLKVAMVGEVKLGLGSDVVVTLPGLLPQQGVTRWRHDGFYGINFNAVMPLSTLVGWLKDQRGNLRSCA